MDIKPTFKFLLGRPGIQDLGDLASTLHQLVKLNHNRVTIAIHAPPLHVSYTIEKLLSQIIGPEGDMYGFQMDESVQAVEDYGQAFLDPHWDWVVYATLLSNGYFPEFRWAQEEGPLSTPPYLLIPLSLV